jgi:hypothetical protein
MTQTASILLVDDDEKLLAQLADQLAPLLRDVAVDIRTWAPVRADDAMGQLDQLVDDTTLLVVTDFDLTTGGQTGFFGPTVVGWCQQRAVAVGDFSRKTKNALPKEPNFFELRVPSSDAAAEFVANAFRGFLTIRDAVAEQAEQYQSLRSPASVLAQILGRPNLESQLALYSPRLGSSSGALLQRILATAPDDIEPSQDEKLKLLAYVAGHVLLNAVLKYPGPILSADALCAYCGVASDQFARIADIFSSARYQGPFAAGGEFFWREEVDDILEALRPDEDDEVETLGEINRIALEQKLGEQLGRHGCGRCGGQNGGFYCPFTRRAVCTRPSCSVGSSSWLPDGASACRIEKDFYEEWAPLLGF